MGKEAAVRSTTMHGRGANAGEGQGRRMGMSVDGGETVGACQNRERCMRAGVEVRPRGQGRSGAAGEAVLA